MDERNNVNFNEFNEDGIRKANVPEITPREAVIRMYGSNFTADSYVGANNVRPYAGANNVRPQNAASQGVPMYYDPYAADFDDLDERPKRRSGVSGFARALALCAMGLSLGLGAAIGLPVAEQVIIPRLINEENRMAHYLFDDSDFNLGAIGLVAGEDGYAPARFPFTYAYLVDVVKPSVVTITTITNIDRWQFGVNRPWQAEGAGSGFIFDATDTMFYIATNAHVIEGAIRVSVSIDGSPLLNAFPVGRCDDNDLAVIAVPRVHAQRAGVHSATVSVLGCSDSMRVGDIVLAMGNSLGEGIVVTDGIISGINRRITLETNITLDVLQTNAAINQGNSGGPLVNLRGEVIGINTAKASRAFTGGSMAAIEGTGYAIPSNVAKRIIVAIMNGEMADSVATAAPRLGITGRTVTEEDAERLGIPQHGVFIDSVNDDEAACEAGVLPNDVITAVNGVAVADFDSLREQISRHRPGDTITLTVLRNGTEVLTLEAVLGASF